MNVLIVENEKPAASGLSSLLKKIDPSIHIMGTTESVEYTINWIENNNSPDLIFMDIQLDDGLCFEIFESVMLDVPIIFTTAYDEYTLSAFKVNSVDYLLKPIEESSLRTAIEKFKSIHYKRNVTKEMLTVLNKEISTGFKTRFLVKIGAHYKSIQTNEIACFYILERGTFIRTFSENDYSIDFFLDNVQTMVDPKKFYRINRNCIVNIDAIKDMLSYSSSRLKINLKNVKPIYDLIVSKEKVREFKLWMDR